MTKEYLVTALMTAELTAQALAKTTDGGEFDRDEHRASWQIIDVREA